ncbi:MAG: sigma-70 family RNA polymerase sigma factor [Pyrinomonadaceae bacterium]|nr:sigma-70 family RNA polymerase sigma factor [Pyrinomonadaceae bacterium]
MRKLFVQNVEHKKDWTLTPGAFRRLLDWLGEGTDSSGQSYLEIRRRLVAYFDRKNCPAPDDLADETLNRVARRLDEEGVTESEAPAKYCYIMARFVFMEHLRGAQKTDALLDDLRRRQPHGTNLAASETDDGHAIKEKMLNCLEQCAGNLEPRSRETIIRYYAGKERAKIENRRALAEELEITMNALSIRACRIRDKLEDCVRRCVGAE